MSNDEQEPKTENLPARVDDGFEENSDTDRLLQGSRAICIDGKWSNPDGTGIPPDKPFLVLSTAEGLQHWEDGKLVEEIIKKVNKPLPDVEQLNAKIPEDTWEDGLNGPRPPWAHVYAAYLLDPADGSIHTHLNSTDGAKIATRQLQSQVKWKRAMLGGRKVAPIVTLGEQLVSRQYKKMGPCFIVKDWRDLTPDPPNLPEVPQQQLEDHSKKELNDSVADIGRPVAERSWEKVLGDKIPEDAWQQSNKATAETTPKASATSPRKPAAQKRPMTKRGVQKIAGGRR
jgi:hypothetical protein